LLCLQRQPQITLRQAFKLGLYLRVGLARGSRA
jgi:hypothetical protein